MKDIPILFTGENVRAILDDRKRVTRRVIKFPGKESAARPWILDDLAVAYPDGGGNWAFWDSDSPGLAEFTKRAYPNGEGIPCPYGKPGDRLWVRETWAVDCHLNHLKPSQIPQESHVFYRENDWSWDNVWGTDKGEIWDRWRPSIHMPRWASRLTLEVTASRPERVQQITWQECKAEGIAPHTFAMGILSDNPPDPRWKFIELWDSIYKKRGYPWESNPWVWVVEFKRVTR